jgi:hypothetical protein
MKKITESNSSHLAGWVKCQRDLIPAHVERWGNSDNWTPEKGAWYAAEKAGTIGGGWGGAGSGAWEDKGINVLPGDKFRLLAFGNASAPSVWEVEFTSPLR